MMNQFIPPFDFRAVLINPWTQDLELFGWIWLMGFLVSTACGLIGTYLLLRRMALVGDAISHSVLPGLVIAFMIWKTRNTWVMFAGALVSGLLTVVIIETIHKRTRVKPDAAICIAFTSLFAVGVLLTSAIDQGGLHIDAECVLYGEVSSVPLEPKWIWQGQEIAPPAVLRMAGVAVAVALLIALFYKELLLSSFDRGLTVSLGYRPEVLHYGLMAMLSIVVVSAFEAVGAVLVVAMLIIPGMTAAQLSDRLPVRLALVPLHGALSAAGGIHLGLWLNCSLAGAMVVVGAGLFVLTWLFSPLHGVVFKKWRRTEALEHEAAV